MVQETGKFVRYREKFEIEKFEIEKGYAVLLGEISRDQTFCSRQRDIRGRGQSRQRESTVFFFLIIKLILPLRLLRQDLEKLHIFISLLLLLRSLPRDSDKKNIILTFTTFIFLLHSRLLQPSPYHDQDNSFFISLLCYTS